MTTAYFGGKSGADKYRKMMGKEKYPGEHNVSRSKTEWKEFYKQGRAKHKALEKAKEYHGGSYEKEKYLSMKKFHPKMKMKEFRGIESKQADLINKAKMYD